MDFENDPTVISERQSRRRQFLGTLGAAGLIGAAGCLGGDDDDADDDGDDHDHDDDGDDGDEPDPDPAVFEVSDASEHDVTQGESVSISATVTNTGEAEGTQEILLLIEDEEEDSTELSLEGGEDGNVSFSVDTTDYEPDDYEYEVASDDDEDGGTFTVSAVTADDPLLSFETEQVETGSSEVVGTLENPYTLAVEDGEVSLTVPEGWEVTGESGATFDSIDSGSSQGVVWDIEVPDDVDPETEYDLTATVEYTVGGETVDFEVEHAVTVFVEQSEQAYWSADGYDVGENPEDSWEALEHAEEWHIEEDDDGQYMSVIGPDVERSYVRFIEAPESLEVEIYATLKATDDEEGDYWAFARSHNEEDADNVEQARVDDQLGGGSNRLAEYDNGNFNELATREHVAGADGLYHMRAQYHGSTWRARWWLPGEDEPEEWDLEAETAAEEHAGYTGVAHWTGEPFRVYDYGVGTGGESAPSE